MKVACRGCANKMIQTIGSCPKCKMLSIILKTSLKPQTQNETCCLVHNYTVSII